MGVLNVTPDSFSDGGRYVTVDAALERVEQMLAEGATIIDVGGYSSRPGAIDIEPAEELARVVPAIAAITARFPDVAISIDTFRTEVAAASLDAGARIVNDISAGRDPAMFALVAEAGAGYVAMHMQGVPQTMQADPRYGDVVAEIADYLAERLATARAAGITRLWCDPGFGFGKTLEHNFALLAHLDAFTGLGAPVLVGLSRKGMFWRLLDADPGSVLPATSAAHLVALQAGVDVIRVHDVAAAAQVLAIAAQVAAAR